MITNNEVSLYKDSSFSQLFTPASIFSLIYLISQSLVTLVILGEEFPFGDFSASTLPSNSLLGISSVHNFQYSHIYSQVFMLFLIIFTNPCM